MEIYQTLAYDNLSRNTVLTRPVQMRPGSVSMDDPALLVMTDLRRTLPFVIEPLASIDEANKKMLACGVRLLFVTDASSTILGLITATDILGEKPVTYLETHGGTRDQILVEDIMTPREDLEAFHFGVVARAQVGDVVATLKMFGRQHMLVIDFDASQQREAVCGLFSSTQIGRQLGMDIIITERANTFAELESLLASA